MEMPGIRGVDAGAQNHAIHCYAVPAGRIHEHWIKWVDVAGVRVIYGEKWTYSTG